MHPPLARLLPWPAPALLAWAAGWAAAMACRHAGAAGWQLAAGTAAACMLALATNAGTRRRLIAALGFPLSALALALADGHLSAWAWLVALAPLALVYPLRAWRDAPFFPTPAAALHGLERIVQPPPRCVLDAGCGLGHGLVAVQRLWPQAQLHGVEWSAPMAWLASRRVAAARIERADMWQASWAGFDLVYLFQRPESMARAWAKATAEIGTKGAGGWLVSLEFAVPGVSPTARLEAPGGGRPVYVYRLPGSAPKVAHGAGRAPAARSTTAAPGR